MEKMKWIEKKKKYRCKDCKNFDLTTKKEKVSCSYEDVSMKDEICKDFIHVDEVFDPLIKQKIGKYMFDMTTVGTHENISVTLEIKRGRKVIATLENYGESSLHKLGQLFNKAEIALIDRSFIKEGFEDPDIIKKRKSILLADYARVKILFNKKADFYRVGKTVECPVCHREVKNFLLTDGVYLWSQLFVHLVLEHLRRPSVEFLKHVRATVKKKGRKIKKLNIKRKEKSNATTVLEGQKRTFGKDIPKSKKGVSKTKTS